MAKEPSRRIDPLILGLLQRLPPPSQPWPEVERKEWLATLEANLKLVYKSAPTSAEKPGAQPVRSTGT